jgi:hypothetical protein
MSIACVEWLLGSPGHELTADQLPCFQDGRPVVTGERFFRWDADPHGWRSGDYVILSFDGGAVKEIHVREVPLS